MPSPIAHSVTGYVLSKQFLARDRDLQKGLPRKLLLFGAVFTANIADFDFVLSLLSGVDVHRGFSHSLVFSLCFSLLVTAAIQTLHNVSWKKLFLFTASIYTSHLLLDFFTEGGDGIQLLWPLSQEHFRSAISLFPGVHHSEGPFYWGHFIFIAYESIYAILLIKIVSSKKLRVLLDRFK